MAKKGTASNDNKKTAEKSDAKKKGKAKASSDDGDEKDTKAGSC